MAINIKNERTVDAVKRLAAHYGVGYTTAIHRAAEAVLAAPEPSARQRALADIERITAEYRAHLPAAGTLDEGGLYGEDGLYR